MNIYDCRNSCDGRCVQVDTCACCEPEPCCRPVECKPVCCQPVCCEPVPCCQSARAARSYAMFHTSGASVATGTALPLTPALIGPNGTIVSQSPTEVYLAQGHVYEVSYQVTASMAEAGGTFMIDPLLNASPEVNYSTSATVAQNGGSASVASTFLVSSISAPNVLSLYYTGATAYSLGGVLVVREIA